MGGVSAAGGWVGLWWCLEMMRGYGHAGYQGAEVVVEKGARPCVVFVRAWAFLVADSDADESSHYAP